MQQLIQNGKVIWPWIGIGAQDIDLQNIDVLDLNVTEGVLISDVQDDSPAKEAGFERGDILIEYGNKAMGNVNQLRNVVAQTEVGIEVKVKVLRKGNETVLTVKIGEQPSALFASAKLSIGKNLGISVQNLTEELAKSFGFEGENGIVVSAVEPGSPAAQADVKEGDLIKEVNREKINNIKEFREALKSAEEGKDILLLIRRGMHTRFVIIKGKVE